MNKKKTTTQNNVCQNCKFWERDKTWSPKDGIVEKRYGECLNDDFYRSFSWAYQYDIERQFPTAKPDEQFGCIFFKKTKIKWDSLKKF